MAFRKAQRKKAKLRLAITGTAGSGKTYGAILIALGLGGKIAMIDTENGSGELYSSLGDYDVCTLSAPYSPLTYIKILHEAEQSGYNTVIIDSLSHAWNGEGGLLDMQADVARRSNNSYTAWRDVTPLQNKLIEAIIQSPCHIIATMRSKTEYVISKDDNERRVNIKKAGLAPIQRDGMDYEFTTVFDVAADHAVTVSKDRTGIFGDRSFTITPKVGEVLKKWLDAEPVEQDKKGE